MAAVTRLLNPPKPVEVTLDPAGSPCYLRGHPLIGDLEAVQNWRVDTDWWDNPVCREYWRVLLRGRLLCEIFHECDQDAWFIERIFD